MNKISLAIMVTVSLGFAAACPAQTTTSTTGGSMAPYVEGPVWQITLVRTKPGLDDDYLKNISSSFKGASEEAKKQGIIVDYKILVGDAAGRDDFNIMLMTEYKNMAALDGLRDKTDPILRKMMGGEDALRQTAVKRLEIREILGDKTMREVTLK